MREAFALLAIGMILLVVWVTVVQAARAIVRARARRQVRVLRLCSVVTGAPASPDWLPSFSQTDANPVVISRVRAHLPYAVSEFAAAAATLARHARN
jgi:hypothetical protein